MRLELGVIGAATVLLAFAVPAGGAAPAAADVELNIGAAVTTGSTRPPALVPNGGSVTVTRKTFWVDLEVSLISTTPGGRVKVRAELGGGLRWGADEPDPTESCTSTPTSGECLAADLQPVTGQSSTGWTWQVVAAENGSYSFRAEIVEAPDVDPVLANNSSSITIVVNEATGGSGGGGGGGASQVSASAVKVVPSKPKAGSAVVASVRVTRDGVGVRPTRVACSATVGGAKLRTAAKAATGLAACSFKPPRSAVGKRLTGSIAFQAGGRGFARRFAVRIG